MDASQRRSLALLVATAALGIAACGGDDDSSSPTGDDGESTPLTRAQQGATCLSEEGFESLSAEIFLTETERIYEPDEGHSILAVAEDGRDIQIMIFADPDLAEEYAETAASDGDNIVREPVADGEVIVESGFRAEDGESLEDPVEAETIAAIEDCL